MTDERDIPRWTAPGSDAPHELRRLISHSRNQLGTPEQIGALSRQLSALLGPQVSLPAPPPALVPKAVAWGWLAAGAAGTLGAALTMAWLLSGSGSNEPVAPDPRPAATESSAPAPTPAVEPMPAPVEAAREPEIASEPPKQAPKAAAPARTRPHTAAPSGEAELLESARAALPTRPAQALRLTEQHTRRFKAGALAEEREVIAIEALKRLGRDAEAQKRAARFEQRYRGSVHQNKIDGAGGSPSPR